jgi:outer membrane biosynthesis protein TonB
MKKLIALFTAMAFALTLGVAFAQETPAPAAPKAEEKAPMTHKEKKKAKKEKKKAKKEAKKAPKKEEAAPMAPAAPAGK